MVKTNPSMDASGVPNHCLGMMLDSVVKHVHHGLTGCRCTWPDGLTGQGLSVGSVSFGTLS